MKKIIAAVLLSTAVAVPAFAADSPFYVGVQVGDGTTILGGYQIDKVYSVEADYTSYDGHTNINYCGNNNNHCGNYYDYSSFGVFGVGTFPMSLKGAPQFSLFGKLGVVRTAHRHRVAGLPYPESHTSLGFGGGAQYDFNKNVSARLGLDFNKRYADDLYIGAIFKF